MLFSRCPISDSQNTTNAICPIDFFFFFFFFFGSFSFLLKDLKQTKLCVALAFWKSNRDCYFEMLP